MRPKSRPLDFRAKWSLHPVGQAIGGMLFIALLIWGPGIVKYMLMEWIGNG